VPYDIYYQGKIFLFFLILYLIIAGYEKYINMLYYIDTFRNKKVRFELRKKFIKS